MPIFDFTETLNDYSDSEISENSKYEFFVLSFFVRSWESVGVHGLLERFLWSRSQLSF